MGGLRRLRLFIEEVIRGDGLKGAPVRAVADFLALAGRGLGLVPRLEPESLAKAAGVSLDEDPRAREPLVAMCDSMQRDLEVAPRGRMLMGRRLVEILRQRRLLLDRDEAGELPEASDSNPPIVVTGFPRSGTTLSHRILALAEDARTPQWCELIQPSLESGIKPDRARRRRLARHRTAIRTLDLLAPDLRRIHELIADGPEECTHLHELALDSESFGLLGPVQHYRDWIDDRDEARRRERYEWQDRCLRAIVADRRADDPGRRWVLKAPQHLCQLDDLLERFPGTLVVRMHRDPVSAMASTGSLVACASKIVTRGLPPGLGEDLLEIFMEWQDRGDASVARHPQRILEMHYDDLVADPVAFVAHVHEAAGIPASGNHLDRVRAHLRHRPRHHFGRHAYSIADYGLDENDVRTRLVEYERRVTSIPRITGPVSPPG
ncbi:MAG: sulfotransferase [Phycisphaera sp.]|nr:sulfotransferase [Phycisphaera sp.]